MKKVISIFLALCMIVTTLPVSAMAEEAQTDISECGEITSFAPLEETEKTVSPGTSVEDLEFPERLTATVRTAVPIGEDAVQDSGSPETATPTIAAEPEWEETAVDIPVTWESTPEYDMNAEGAYVFAPVIEGYIVSAEPPEITVTVGTIVAQLTQPMTFIEGEATEISSLPDLQTAITSATENLNVKLSDSFEESVGTLTIGSGNTFHITIDLNNHTLNGGTAAAIQHSGSGTLTITDTAEGGGGKVTSARALSSFGTIQLASSTADATILEITGGTIESTGAGSAIYNAGNGDMSISGGTVQAGEGIAIYNAGNGDMSISGGTVQAGTGSAIWNVGSGKISVSGTDTMVTSACASTSYGTIYLDSGKTGSLEITGGTVESTGAGSAINNKGNGEMSISGGTVQAGTSSAIWNVGSGKISVSGTAIVTSAPSSNSTIYLKSGTAGATILEMTGGTVENTGDGIAIYNGGNGDMSISGGTVQAGTDSAIYNDGNGDMSISGGTVQAETGYAIWNKGSGKISVSGTAIVTSASSSNSTIYLNYSDTAGSLEMTGGTVENTSSGNAIYNGGNGEMSISGGTVENTGTGCAIYNGASGKISIPSGSPIIRGGSAAMNKAPI